MSSRRKRAKQPPKKHILPFMLLYVLLALCIVGAVTFVSVSATVDSWLKGLPEVSDVASFNIAQKTRVYASDNTTEIASFYSEDREPVALDQIAQDFKDATVAIEDERFYQHEGVDFYGVARAAFNDLFGSTREGASTITQQFVRQTLLKEEANDISIKRKVREMYLATEVEKRYAKDEILLMYMNTVNYGDGSYGVQSAAQHYFSKDAKDLTMVQAALLAGIPQSPTYNNPIYYPDQALKRRNAVLNRMRVNGYITQAQYDEYAATEIKLKVRKKVNDGISKVPYFSTYVRKLLEEEYSTTTVFTSGLTVYTTIDLKLQAQAEKLCKAREATQPADIEYSLTSLEPNTGYIRVMRGGKDFNKSEWNTSTQMARSAGSTFKMFALVALLEDGVSPMTSVSGSSPVTIDGWRVQNDGGGSFGMLSVARAVAVSSNTAFARIVRTLGAEPIVDVAQRMGITSPLQAYPSVVLGAAGGVNTLEMASAFGTLAAEGMNYEPVAITKIVDSTGKVVFEHKPEGKRAISASVAYAATQVLEGVITGGTGTAARLPNQIAAGKSGTSESYRDAWFCGYTPQLSTAIWMGSHKERRISGMYGGQQCAPLWKAFMEQALKKYPKDKPFTKASPITYDKTMVFTTPAERAAAAAYAKKAAEAAAKKKADAAAKKKDTDDSATPPPTDTGESGGSGGSNPSTGGSSPPAGTG